jgi:hypothetical protein
MNPSLIFFNFLPLIINRSALEEGSEVNFLRQLLLALAETREVELGVVVAEELRAR